MRPAQSSPEDETRARLIVAAVSLEFDQPEFRLTADRRGGPQICMARQVAMYLLHTLYNINLSRTSQLFQRDRSTAAHACNVIEDGRDDPVFDDKISRLEAFLAQAPHKAEAELC